MIEGCLTGFGQPFFFTWQSSEYHLHLESSGHYGTKVLKEPLPVPMLKLRFITKSSRMFVQKTSSRA